MLRFERKFRVEFIPYQAIQHQIQNLPHSFSKAFPDRYIHNIYFDTPGFQFYHENMSGIDDREKYRIRWYGNHFREITKPILEIKYKRNNLGGKKQFDFPLFQIDQIKSLSKWMDPFIHGQTILNPVLLNTYQRSYYISWDEKFRITIDRKMGFQSILNTPIMSDFFIEDPAVVVELKYDQIYDQEAMAICQALPFRQTKNSKYINGLFLTV